MISLTTSKKSSKRSESHSLPKSLKTKLERSVDQHVQSSSFLQRSKKSLVVQLERKQIQLGIHLGEGTFSDVYQVLSFSSQQSSAAAEPQAATALTTTTGQQYAIKIPKNPEEQQQRSKATSLLQRFVGRGILRRSRSNLSGIKQEDQVQVYTRSCIDLILEGKYLAAMDHPNIIKVRGFSLFTSPEAPPFLVMDRLIDTLDKRIEQWRTSGKGDSLSISLRSSSSSNRRNTTSTEDNRPSPPRRWKTMSKSFRLRSSTRKMIDTSCGSVCSVSSTRSASSIVLEELEDLQEEDPMDLLQERATYALQIAQALQYLHQNRIILRDLKPNNVGFVHCPTTGKDVVQLFDFGLCRELPTPPPQDKTTTEADVDCNDEFHMSIAGTTRYMAPEIITRHGVYGLKADIYSWGVLTYELLTLERPYAAVCSTPELHKRFVCRDGVRPIFPNHKQYLRDETLAPYLVPQAVQKIIETSWAQDILERPTATQLCNQLQSLLENDFIPSTPTPLLVTNPSPASTNEPGPTPAKVLSSATPTASSSIIPPTQPLSLIDAMISSHAAALRNTGTSPRTA